MLKLGEIRKGAEIERDSHKYIWHACIKCGKERWVGLNHGKPTRLKCRSCGAKKPSLYSSSCKGTAEHPAIGDIRRGIEVAKSNSHYYIWLVCSVCGKGRWTIFSVKENKAKNPLCRYCWRRSNKHNWKGGRIKNANGYIDVFIQHDDFFYSMASKRGYAQEHRIVMAKYLKRCLLPWEIVHHKNGVKDDNKLENLQLLPSRRYHIVDLVTKSRIKILERQLKAQSEKILSLEIELTLLRAQLIDNAFSER